MFREFKKELEKHNKGKYHDYRPASNMQEASSMLISMGIDPLSEYLKFLEDFGPGKYYGGLLVFYPVRGAERSVESEIKYIRKKAFFPIGDGGSGESLFCLSKTKEDQNVYEYSVFDGRIRKLCQFSDWINKKSKSFFDKKLYIKFNSPSPEIIEQVEKAREKFEVILVKSEKNKVKKLDSDFMPCFNLLSISIEKKMGNELDWLTIKVCRTGSSIGNLNNVYHSIYVKDIPVGEKRTFDELVPDQFSVSFNDIILVFESRIDLERISQYRELTL